MDLETLPGSRDITPAEFRALFALRLDNARLSRATLVVSTLPPGSAYSVGNVIYMALQKDTKAELEHETVDRALEALEKWCSIVVNAPNQIVAAADTRRFFDVLYVEFFLGEGDGPPGLHPLTSRPQPTLWTPASTR